METFSALLALCAGNSPGTGEFPSQRPVTRGFDVFVDLRPNKRLSKQSRGWWFERKCLKYWKYHIQVQQHSIRFLSMAEKRSWSWHHQTMKNNVLVTPPQVMGGAYMHQWTGTSLVQVMACQATRHYLIILLSCKLWQSRTNFDFLYQNTYSFQWNAFQISSILFNI